MAAHDPKELVEIYNAKLHTGDDPPVAQTTREAFETTWKPLGYKLTSEARANTGGK